MSDGSLLNEMSDVFKALESLSSGIDRPEKLGVELCALVFVMSAFDSDHQSQLDDVQVEELDRIVASLTERLMRDREGAIAQLKEMVTTKTLTVERLQALCAT